MRTLLTFILLLAVGTAGAAEQRFVPYNPATGHTLGGIVYTNGTFHGDGSDLTGVASLANGTRATNFSMWGSGPADGTQLWYNDEQLVYTAGTWYFGGGVDFSGAEVEGLVGITTTASGVPLAARGTAAQTANLFEAQDADSNVVASVSAAGVFTGNGSGLTSVTADDSTHALTSDSLSGNINGISFQEEDVVGWVFTGALTGNGSGLTNLNASVLASGTVPDARLPVSRSVAFSQTNTLAVYGSTNVGTVGFAVYQTNSTTPILWSGPVTAASNPWRVGIGTASPAYTLDVLGIANASTYVRSPQMIATSSADAAAGYASAAISSVGGVYVTKQISTVGTLYRSNALPTLASIGASSLWMGYYTNKLMYIWTDAATNGTYSLTPP